MKEVCKVIVWEADGTRFESKETCGICELMIKKSPGFSSKILQIL